MSLETEVAKQVYLAKLLERALHDKERWSAIVDGYGFPVHIEEVDDGVLFKLSMPLLSEGAHTVEWCFEGEALVVHEVDWDGSDDAEIQWHLTLSPSLV